MLANRDDKLVVPEESEKRIGILFTDDIQAAINAFHHNKFDSIRLHHSNLENALNTGKNSILDEEKNREPLPISETKANEIEEYEKQIESFEQQLRDAQDEFDTKEKESVFRRDEISREIKSIESDFVIKDVQEKTERGTLHGQLEIARDEQKAAERKLDSVCCFKSKEKKEYDYAKEKYDNAVLKINNFEKNSVKAITQQKVEQLREEEKKIQENFNRILLTEYPEKKANLERKKAETEKMLEVKRIDHEMKKEEFSRILSNKNMFYYLYSYACFIEFKENINRIYITYKTEYEKKKKSPLPETNDLKLLQEKIQSIGEKLSKLMKQCWCPTSADRTGYEIYHYIYLPLALREKKDFLEGVNNKELVNKLVPVKMGPRLHLLTREDTPPPIPFRLLATNPLPPLPVGPPPLPPISLSRV